MHIVALVYNHFLFLSIFWYNIKESELQLDTVSVSEWDKNWFGKKSFLGEFRLPLSALDITNSTNHWYSLEDKVHMTNYS